MNAFSFDVKTVQYLHLTSSPRLNIHNALRKFNCEQVDYVQKWGARKLVLFMCRGVKLQILEKLHHYSIY